MRVALIGYGKMGHTIESILLERGHTISYKVSIDNTETIHQINLDNTDVCIEFTHPGVAFDYIRLLSDSGLPVVCGTTGWYDRLEEAKAIVLKNNTALVVASNFSIGVNLFFEAARDLARLMHGQDYTIRINESHHIEKKDAPSGTAITLSEEVRSVYNEYSGYQLNRDSDPSLLPIFASRIADVPGTHELIFKSGVDAIVLQHVAFNRQGFALGAVVAAEYIWDKKGIFSIRDILMSVKA